MPPGIAEAQRASPTPRAEPPLTASDVAFALRYGPLPADSTGRPHDHWIARDKARHVVFSGLWTLSTQYVLVRKAGWDERAALPLSIGTAAAVGGLKELYDATHPQRTASGKDLVANTVGIGLAAGLILW